MSLESWIKKWYPVDANDVPHDKLAAVEHSLLKWKGLTPGKLADDEVEHSECIIRGTSLTERMEITSETCALCLQYLRSPETVEGEDVHGCSECPLFQARGCACDKKKHGEVYAPYHTWIYTGDAQPMIQALLDARILVLQERGSPEVNKANG